MTTAPPNDGNQFRLEGLSGEALHQQSLEGGPRCLVESEQPDCYRYVGDIAVGLDPEGVDADERTGLVYVACSRSNHVAVVDPATLSLVTTVPVGTESIDVAIDHRTGRAFSANARSNSVSVIDLTTHETTDNVAVGEYPAGLAIDEARRRLFCGNTMAGTVSVIDPDTLEVVATVEAELGAGAIAVDAVQGRAYCVNFVGSSATVIDCATAEVVGRVPLREGACDVAINDKRSELYAVNSLASTVSRVDLQAKLEPVAEMRVPNAPVGIVAAPGGDRFYVSNRGDGSVSIVGVDGAEWARVPVGTAPGGITVHPHRPRVVMVSNAGTGTLTLFEDLLDGPRREGAVVSPHPLVGQQVPQFSLPDKDGRTRHIREWAGKRYIINVFASW